MYYFEQRSLYIDVTFITNYFYKRYIDDAGNTDHSKAEAELRMQSIAAQDEDNLLQWEVDFPISSDKFTPFLNSEVRINEDGSVESRLYRKPHSKKHHTPQQVPSPYSNQDSDNQEQLQGCRLHRIRFCQQTVIIRHLG